MCYEYISPDASISSYNSVFGIKKSEDAIEKFRSYATTLFEETGLEILHDINADFMTMMINDMAIDDIIVKYIKRLDGKEISSIICDYGINKALALFYNYHYFAMGNSTEVIVEFMKDATFENDVTMVNLIFRDTIGFYTVLKRFY